MGSGNGSGSTEETMLASLAEELHDIKRVKDYGQEEDLREALGKMITRVEELVCLSPKLDVFDSAESGK